MQVSEPFIKDLKIIEPRIFPDDRGYFFEPYNKERYMEMGIPNDFVQDNESLSAYGVLRGLHFQTGKHAQAKLIRVIQGAIFDIAIDLRPKSSTFGQYFGIELTSENKLQIFIPRGFAHGFLSLKQDTILHYKCDNYYQPNAEGGIRFDDPHISIDWPKIDQEYIVSNKDLELPSFEEFQNAEI